jgi:hypothetical protein
MARRAFDVVLKDVAARSERGPTVRMSDLSAHTGEHEGSSDDDDEAAAPSTSGDAHVADPVQLAAASKCGIPYSETLYVGVSAPVEGGSLAWWAGWRLSGQCGTAGTCRSKGNAAFGAGDHGAAFTHYSNALAWCVTPPCRRYTPPALSPSTSRLARDVVMEPLYGTLSG